MKKTVFLFLIGMLISKTQLIGQTDGKLDSLLATYALQDQDTSKVKTASALFEEFFKSNPTKALAFAQDGLVLAKQLDYEKGIAVSALQIGNSFFVIKLFG